MMVSGKEGGYATHMQSRVVTSLEYIDLSLYPPERRGQCRQRLEIAGTVCSACGLGELTRPDLPGAKGKTRGYYGPCALDG